ncbi:MAG: GHKL domain-containing protein [Clostridia bacterium]|nr:GHKL domain-containing protein [Clostridia bacterium]
MISWILSILSYIIIVVYIILFIAFCIKISDRSAKRLTPYEADLVAKHYEEIKNIYQVIRGWRHDYQNQLQTMNAFLELGNVEELGNYIRELSNDLDSLYTFVKTGNVVVDAVVGSKLAVCKTKNIYCETKFSLPENCKINDVDLCVILSNLLDNSIDACGKIENEKDRIIRLNVEVFKGQFYINIANTVKESPKKSGNKFISSKGKNHGFGLGRIDRTVDKYGGFVNRCLEDNLFITEIMIPLKLE